MPRSADKSEVKARARSIAKAGAQARAREKAEAKERARSEKKALEKAKAAEKERAQGEARVEPAKPPRRGRGSLSREEIIQAALALLREEGLEKLSMRRIARRLGCSVASPYAHFENQDEIIKTMIVQGEKRLTAGLRKAQAGSDDTFEQLKAIAEEYWDFASKDRELHRIMFNVGGGYSYRKVFPSLPTSYRVFMETIRRGMQKGDIRADRGRYRAIAGTLWAWMYGLIVLEMTDTLRSRSDDPIGDGIRLFEPLLRGDSPGP